MQLKFVKWEWDTDPQLAEVRFFYRFEVEPTGHLLTVEVYSAKMRNIDSTVPGFYKSQQEEDALRVELSKKIFTAVESVIVQNGIRLTEQEIITLHDGENFECSDVATDYEGYTHTLA